MAQLMKENGMLHTSCGSPHYASPEIINGGACALSLSPLSLTVSILR